MQSRPLRAAAVLVLVALTLLLACDGVAVADKPASTPEPKTQFTAAQIASFEKDVLPILQANCFKCHGAGKSRGGLRLNSRETILKGGDTGPAVSLDKPNESLLLRAINYKNEPQMPPGGKLPQKDIETLTRWVRDGLPWTTGTAVVEHPGNKGGRITEESK